MAILHDLSTIPALCGNGIQLKTQTSTGPALVATLALCEMQQRLSHKVWEQAALYHHGFGAENGVNMTVLHRHHKQLVARGAHVRAGMLYKIATAQIHKRARSWSPSRLCLVRFT